MITFCEPAPQISRSCYSKVDEERSLSSEGAARQFFFQWTTGKLPTHPVANLFWFERVRFWAIFVLGRCFDHLLLSFCSRISLLSSNRHTRFLFTLSLSPYPRLCCFLSTNRNTRLSFSSLPAVIQGFLIFFPQAVT